MHELLMPQFKDISRAHASEFAGMTREEVPFAGLLATRERLANIIHTELDSDERCFLLSIKQGDPKWDILGIQHLAELPALKWKLQNIARMDRKKHAAALEKLRRVLRL